MIDTEVLPEELVVAVFYRLRQLGISQIEEGDELTREFGRLAETIGGAWEHFQVDRQHQYSRGLAGALVNLLSGSSLRRLGLSPILTIGNHAAGEWGRNLFDQLPPELKEQVCSLADKLSQ